jgi:uncharacterized protein
MQSSIMPRTIVVDTNVFIGALLGRGASNRLVDACLAGEFQPLMGAALFSEYEDVVSREALFASSLLGRKEREEVLDIFLASCRWVHVYFAWRPNLRDEADNHLIELALAGGAEAVVTMNKRDLSSGELRFPQLSIVTPQELLGALR